MISINEAAAEAHRYTVVTEETGPDSLRKIPGVCVVLHVPWMNLMDLFDAENWGGRLWRIMFGLYDAVALTLRG